MKTNYGGLETNHHTYDPAGVGL